jgi:cell division protein FtsL
VTATQRWQGAGGTALGARRAGGAVPVAPADARGKRPQARGSSRRPADSPVRAGEPRARAAEGRARDVPVARGPATAVSRRRLRRLRPRGVGAVALAVLAFSALGLLYLLQISRVASYGYTLSTIQARQAQLDREYELLLYQVSQERTPARVDDLARREYGMQPLDPGADATGQPPAAAGTGAAAPPAKP